MRWTSPRWPSPTSGTLDVARDSRSLATLAKPSGALTRARAAPPRGVTRFAHRLAPQSIPLPQSGLPRRVARVSACSRSSGQNCWPQGQRNPAYSSEARRAERSPVVSRDPPNRETRPHVLGWVVRWTGAKAKGTVTRRSRCNESRRAGERATDRRVSERGNAAKAAMDQRGIPGGRGRRRRSPSQARLRSLNRGDPFVAIALGRDCAGERKGRVRGSRRRSSHGPRLR